MGIKFGNGTEWKLNLRHHGNGIGNGNELMGTGGTGNVASHSRTSLVKSNNLLHSLMMHEFRQVSAVADKPARRAASRRRCCKQITCDKLVMELS